MKKHNILKRTNPANVTIFTFIIAVFWLLTREWFLELTGKEEAYLFIGSILMSIPALFIGKILHSYQKRCQYNKVHNH